MDCRGIKTNIDNTFATGMYYQDKLCSCQAFDCFMKYWNSPDFKSRMKQFKNYSPSVFNELIEISETWKERYKIAENPKLKEMLYNIHNLLDDVIDNGKYDVDTGKKLLEAYVLTRTILYTLENEK